MADTIAKPSDPSGREEGINTLAAQFTRRLVARYIGLIQRELAKGTPEEKIVAEIARAPGGYDDHSCALLLRLAAGDSVPDDFPPEIVVKREQPKDNTVVLTLSASPSGIQQYSLVHHHGAQWLVVERDKDTWMLKALEEGKETD